MPRTCRVGDSAHETPWLVARLSAATVPTARGVPTSPTVARTPARWSRPATQAASARGTAHRWCTERSAAGPRGGAHASKPSGRARPHIEAWGSSGGDEPSGPGGGEDDVEADA